LYDIVKFREKTFVALANFPPSVSPIALAAQQEINNKSHNGKERKHQEPAKALKGLFATEENK
jgi:hypothetical protein